MAGFGCDRTAHSVARAGVPWDAGRVGLLLNVTGWDPPEVVDGALLLSDHGQFGPGGRSDYAPAPGCTDRFVGHGDVP